jgi:hypothetical protein
MICISSVSFYGCDLEYDVKHTYHFDTHVFMREEISCSGRSLTRDFRLPIKCGSEHSIVDSASGSVSYK